jgi:hypothetical protein
MNPQLNLIATFHMLDAYDEGREWVCECPACHNVRRSPELVSALWENIRRHPPKPKTGGSPPVLYVPN